MTAFSPEGEAAPGTRHPAFAPFIRLSAAALAENVRAAVTEGPAAVDVRDDAWGHDPRLVAPAALRAGAAAVLIDRMRPSSPGITDDDVQWDEGPVLDPSRVYGLPGPDGMLRGQPVMSMYGRVILVKTLRAGEGVSYGYTHRAAADTRIALVTGGYAHGVVRTVGNHVDVAIGGRTCAVVGRIAMDVSTIEVGDAPVQIGDEVCFFGDPDAGAPSLGAWVTASGLGAPEIVVGIARRTRVDARA